MTNEIFIGVLSGLFGGLVGYIWGFRKGVMTLIKYAIHEIVKHEIKEQEKD